MQLFKRILSGVLAAAMTIGAASMISVGAANVSFTDVSGHWAWTNGQIPYLVEKGVLNGYEQSNGTYIFKPDGEVKRSEFIKMLDETFGLTKTAAINFADVKADSWYAPYFQKAAAQGYILDYGTNANPEGLISREEAASLLVRYLDLPANEKANASTFTDSASISPAYKEYVLRAVYAGILNGYKQNDGTYQLKPSKTLSRAEALTILYRAAGCIYNASIYNREGSAYETNNTITCGNITISNVRFNGRNIVTEGASDGKITFADCDINGTLIVRGGANITLDDCTADEIILRGGGTLNLVNGTEVKAVTVETTSALTAYSNTEIETLTIAYGADNSSLTGNGKLSKAFIRARNFTSSLVPDEFEIGNNLTAVFGKEKLQGSSDTQNSFAFTPFSTADDSSYYLNVLSNEDGKIYYYYTNQTDVPSVSAFDSYYDQASVYGNFDVRSGEPICAPTHPVSVVSAYNCVVLQLQYGMRKYMPVLIVNTGKTDSGFKKEPYVYDKTTIKFQAASSGNLYWFYADDGKQLNQIEFLNLYNNKESALKGETAVNSIQSFSCSLKSKYLENYSYVAFMLKSVDGLYRKPVIVSVGNTGFNVEPNIKTPGEISFSSAVSGDIYYYYSETNDLPSKTDFKKHYSDAKYADNDAVSINKQDTITYDLEYAEEYPYLILSLRNNDGEYMQPLCLEIAYSTGFESGPSVKSATEIRFAAKESGLFKYYYTKSEISPTVEAFTAAYNEQTDRYKGSMKVSTSSASIEYSSTYAVTYPYMAIMFTNEEGTQHSPVLLKLDATKNTGFTIAPYAADGKIYFRTKDDGAVYFFYLRNPDTFAPEDFEEEWDDEYSRGRADNMYVSSGVTETLAIDQELFEKYPYIAIAFTDEPEANHPDFFFPFTLDIKQSLATKAGSGLEVDDPDVYNTVEVFSLYAGKLYWYRTNDKSDLPSGTNDFLGKYSAAPSADRSRFNVDANELNELDMDDFEYLVIALEFGGEFLSPVIVHKEGVQSGSSDSFFDYDNPTYGFTLKSIGTDEIVIEAEVTGTAVLYVYSNGKLEPIGEPHAIEAGERTTIELPEFMSYGDIFDILFGNGLGGVSTEYFIQVTDEDGKKYQACELPNLS